MNALHSFHRGTGRAAALLFAIAMTSAWAAAPTAPPAARSELAPTGKLRVGLIAGNKVFVTKDGTAGEMRGIAVDLGRELAKQLGVPFEPVRYTGVGKLIDGAKAGDWDIAFLGFAQERTKYMDYTAPYLELGNTYLVPVGSKIRKLGDVDKPGLRIGLSERSVQDAYLTKNIKQAQLVRFGGGLSLVGPKFLSSGKVDVLMGNRVQLLDVAAKVPGSRVLEENVNALRHHLAIAKGRTAATAYAKEFIEYAKASGLVKRSIEQAELRGVTVAALGSGM